MRAKIARDMEFIESSCPYCGEPAEIAVDEGGSSRQQFVQDCAVCCQPCQVELVRDREGDWSAILRTGDE